MGDRMNRYIVDIGTLQQIQLFGDVYAEAIASIRSDLAEIEVDRASKDSIGRHWYGFRVRVVDKENGQKFYLHTGLIFLPSTRIGLMVEVDEANNHGPYKQLCERLESTDSFLRDLQEAQYLKLFLPEKQLNELLEADLPRQKRILAGFFQACVEAIVSIAKDRPFRFKMKDLDDMYNAALLYREALDYQSDLTKVTVNEKDRDNFGQYASGYRYWLSDKNGKHKMYAYFGVIFSFKKEPAGIFAEIDEFSNPQEFNGVFERIKEGKSYWIHKEKGFLKLFMKPEYKEKWDKASAAKQKELLEAFVKECSENMVLAAKG